jgi:ribosomal protein RSM22 (predicted rRNA methylase)
MTPALPAWLSQAIAARLEGVSRHDLANASAAITSAYRAGGTSKRNVAEADMVAAYLTVRLPATYAAVSAALARLAEHAPDFAPRSLADIGAGPGTASFAALERFPALAHVAMRDHNDFFLRAARELAGDSHHAALRHADIASGEATAGAGIPPADLVVAAYMLVELPEAVLADTIARLWQAAQGALLLVEPGTPEGFRRIRLARGLLLAAGAHILAPCTHALACPIAGNDWCHFSVRLPRSRDHLAVKQAEVPFEDERFSYLVVARDPGLAAQARILAPPRHAKPGIHFKLCSEGRIDERFVPARDKAAFRAARRLDWGDATAE